MIKNKFISGTIILIIGGLITKLLGMIIKIITTRYVGDEGIGLYMIILPTFYLFINIAQLGFPTAISKVVAEDKLSNKKIIFSIFPVSIILNIILLIVVLMISPLISQLLHDDRTLYPLIAIGFVLPFISISSIVRGYFFGKQKMIAHVTSHIFEQIVRLMLIVFITPILLEISLEAAVTGIVLVNIASELTSIIILIFFLPKKIAIKKDDLIPNKDIIRDVLSISIPTTGSRIVGSIGYFFEPILLTSVLLSIGYSNKFILTEYGILNGYVLPLLLIPSFFTQAISSALIPIISKAYTNNQFIYVKNKIKQAEAISLGLGFLITIIFMIFPEFLLKFVYNTTNGVNYLKIMAPFFLVYYAQVPLTAALQAMGKAKEAMMSTVIGVIIKTGLLVILSAMHIGLYGLVTATIVNIFIVTIYNYIKIKKALI
ncbi:MAG: oligosaccharide flippase family protein [Bacilli bacterium]|nr:oligosaccharide flippase family protein [Bacilli bacterium]MDD3305329.1 oligosaccharide flippase family protein [Bacilli bacterium]MDD4054020.1 oligosaccharide flippase family protein [Bacilli bacterium]MDD4411776.1 oligosaccharide flippase family protein [Bacilli bacterium]